ncbi:MAG: Bug family tripartite tricarboxylate transporter substrate binding protein [Burkholderiales bacterium]
MSIRTLGGTIVVLAAMLVCGSAVAQEYPAKTVRMIVPFTPGGGTDLMARITAAKLGQIFGQQFVVDNRPGAGTVVGSEIAARASGDGYTIIMQVNSLAANHTLYPKLPYDTLKDFIPVVLIGDTPNVLVIHPSMPARTAREFVALAHKRPNEIVYASSGVGGASFLATEYFKMLTGAKMLHVPYKGTAPALSAILAGETQAMIAAAPGTISFIKSGKLRALGVTGEKRWLVMPELPTLMEAGIKDFEFATWYGLFAPRGTSPEIVAKLNTTVNQMLAMPDIKEQMQRGGFQAVGGTPESFAAYFRSEVEKLGKVIRTTGAKP